MTVKAALQFAKKMRALLYVYVTESSFTRPFLLGPVFFRTALSCSVGYHLETDGMMLHDAVETNCKKGATTEN